MRSLDKEIAGLLKDDVEAEIASLSSQRRECRAVFYGPPEELLRKVFLQLTPSGDTLRARMSDGVEVDYPVVLQVEELSGTAPEATAFRSGELPFQRLANFRNLPSLGIFLTLVPSGGQVSDTHASTRKPFGVDPKVAEGNAQISAWLADPFITTLIRRALVDVAPQDQDEAEKLVRQSIIAADAVDQHSATRGAAWNVLERLYATNAFAIPQGSRLALACGFPPSESGSIDADEKARVLGNLVDKLEELNFGRCRDFLQEKANGDQERVDIQDCLNHIRSRCDVLTALRRSMPSFYAPDVEGSTGWWHRLSVERWTALLDSVSDFETEATGSISVTVANPIISHLKGLVPVVEGAVLLAIEMSDDLVGRSVQIIREASTGSPRKEWSAVGAKLLEFEDATISDHRIPIRYSISVPDSQAKKATAKLISLNSWMPGIVVCARTAVKGAAAKATKGKASYETSLSMVGQGRHYFDVYLRPGVTLASATASYIDDRGVPDSKLDSEISAISTSEFGFEAIIEGACAFDIQIVRPESSAAEVVRLHLIADEATAEECASYFEMMLLRNSRDGRRLPRSVHVNGQLRSSQLQGWILDADAIGRSYYPAVLASDYANSWRTSKWNSSIDCKFSLGEFIHDPRPDFSSMTPPATYVEARTELAKRFRGGDDNDLIEAANLGEWTVSDPAFAQLVASYVDAYVAWLQSSPHEAAWSDVIIVTGLESDGVTLQQEPFAIIVSPMHPLRLAWQCAAQRAMYLAQRKLPCPAASILDPDCVPDAITLPLRTATGGIKEVLFLSVESNSDYWGILWNASSLDRLSSQGSQAPFDAELGLLVGGISSGFSGSQVRRAMEDVTSLLVAKPTLRVAVSSSGGQNSACNEGIIAWARGAFGLGDPDNATSWSGINEIHILDERSTSVRPNDAEIANLVEDSNNAIQWYSATPPRVAADLSIIAQLETANAGASDTKLQSSLSVGGLVRTRIREQLAGASGQILCESRMASPAPPSGDALHDALRTGMTLIENLSGSRMGYQFAPSMHAVKTALSGSEFVAVSSSAVDPACFLGGWLSDTYLWDYEMPSYSGRAGDSNGYYLLSNIKSLDLETLQGVLSRLPGCDSLQNHQLEAIVHEVARRGIPTVRGLSGGGTSAAGDLGLFVATRLLQGRLNDPDSNGLLPTWVSDGNETELTLLIPVDPFRRYLDDLAKAIHRPSLHRPDLLVVSLRVSQSSVECKLTPVEVKNRSDIAQMSQSARLEALAQARSLSTLIEHLQTTFNDEPEMVLWRVTYQNLLATIIGYGFRVYSQQIRSTGIQSEWSRIHSRVIDAIFSSTIALETDEKGRLIVIDGSQSSSSKDVDGDGLSETIELSQSDAALIVLGSESELLSAIREKIGHWELMPRRGEQAAPLEADDDLADQVDSPAAPEVAVFTESDSQTNAWTQETPHAEKNTPEDLIPLIALSEVNLPNGSHAPFEQRGLTLRVGHGIDRFNPALMTLNIGDTALNQLNMGVVGDLGTGKTQLLKSLIFQIRRSTEDNRSVAPNILIFDYKKDYSEPDFVEATGARVISPYDIPLNLFDTTEAGNQRTAWLDRFKFFADALSKIYSGIGPVQQKNLKEAVRAAYACSSDSSPTVYDVYERYEEITDSKADSVSSILSDIVDAGLFERDTRKILPTHEFLSGVVVISLNELGQDDRTKNMVVAILLNVFYEHMLRIPKRPFLGPLGNKRVVDSMLLVDEADNIMKYEFDVLRKILLQGREFGVGVILASQYLSHFKAGASDYREPLLTWFIHKVPNVKSQELAALGLVEGSLAQIAERIKTLKLHECLYKTHDVGGEFVHGAPFYQRSSWHST